MLDVKLHRTTSIHLFRHLLRESGYLPDHVARVQLKRQIIHRFRSNQSNRIDLLNKLLVPQQQTQPLEDQNAAIDLLTKRVNSGERWLKTLQNANHGGLVSLRKTLLYAYGRTGRRRYELLQSIMTPDIGHKPRESQQSESDYVLHLPTKSIFGKPKSTESKVEFTISPQYSKLEAHAKSQFYIHDADHVLTRGTKLRLPVFKMKRYNIWKRQMPQKRAKNMLNRWYRKFMHEIVPPLPDWEFNYLSELAAGTESLKLLERRKTVGSVVKKTSSQELEASLFRDMMAREGSETSSTHHNGRSRSPYQVRAPWPVRYDERSHDAADLRMNLADDILDSELQIGSHLPVKRNKRDDRRELSPRALRRVYGAVLRHSARMEKSPAATWKLIWGASAKKQPAMNVSLRPMHSLLFEGKP